MKDKWAKAKKAGVKNLAQVKDRTNRPVMPFDVCVDCEERPTFEVRQITFTGTRKLCNRHFYLFAEKYKKWFLEDEVLMSHNRPSTT